MSLVKALGSNKVRLLDRDQLWNVAIAELAMMDVSDEIAEYLTTESPIGVPVWVVRDIVKATQVAMLTVMAHDHEEYQEWREEREDGSLEPVMDVVWREIRNCGKIADVVCSLQTVVKDRADDMLVGQDVTPEEILAKCGEYKLTNRKVGTLEEVLIQNAKWWLWWELRELAKLAAMELEVLLLTRLAE